MFAHIVIDTLGVAVIVAIGTGDARKQGLIVFVGQQVAVLKLRFPEIREPFVPGLIDFDPRRFFCLY